jgi:hypothetical protein
MNGDQLVGGAQMLTFGQKAVGLRFNPSGDSEVEAIKLLYAQVIDKMNALRNAANENDDREKARLASVAITEAQGAQMWAVKAQTWESEP